MKKALAMLGVSAASLIAFPGAALAADNGDGTTNCVSGEICLSEDSNGTGGLAHFYYDAQHSGLEWHTGGSVEDSFSSLWNRDTACDVTVIDYAEWNEGREYDTFRKGVAQDYVNVNSDMNDDNDAHQRCR